MAELTNDFTWSSSRAGKFGECKRAYYYSYYASWHGWDAKPDTLTRRAYMLKKLTSIVMWKGDVFHRAAEMDLRYFQQKGKPMSPDKLIEWALKTAEDEWRMSENKIILQNPKAVCIYDHYVTDDPKERKLLKNEYEAARTDLKEWLKAYYGSAIREAIMKGAVKTIEQLDSVMIGGVKVWVKMDLAFTSLKKFLLIVDWKTGKPKATDARQLAVYGHYVRDVWHQPLDRMRMLDVYIAHDDPKGNGEPYIVEHRPESEDLDAAVAFIKTSANEMKQLLLTPVSKNKPKHITEFPRCNRTLSGPCRWCNYRPLCAPTEEEDGDAF